LMNSNILFDDVSQFRRNEVTPTPKTRIYNPIDDRTHDASRWAAEIVLPSARGDFIAKYRKYRGLQ
jgi:hypothetical protein